MGKIFVSADRSDFEGTFGDSGAIARSADEVAELIATRDLIVAELKSRGLAVEAPGDDLSLSDTIAWINARANRQDVALAIHWDMSLDRAARGVSGFYIAHNGDRKRQAELMLNSLIRRVPEIPSRGAKPDIISTLGRLSFCRDVMPPSILMELGFITNPQDLKLIQTRRRDFAIGIADGLQAWAKEVAGSTLTTRPESYPEANINLNGQMHEEKAIIVAGNAYIPIDLAYCLSDMPRPNNIRCIRHKSIVYVQAIALRDFNISVLWDAKTPTVMLRNVFKINMNQIDRIMGLGNTSEVQMLMFLKNNNESALTVYGELPRLYREEGNVEGVNYDLAFCQMCVETGFLRFGGDTKPEQNNFAGLGAVGAAQGASFPDQRTGVRAQMQHLKAYASNAPLVQPSVDPRFRFVNRGLAPSLSQLVGCWSVDSNYDRKIMAVMRLLYESAGIF